MCAEFAGKRGEETRMGRIVYERGEDEIVEKKSRFIGEIVPVSSEEEALAYLESVRKKHYNANHHCFAYVLGEKNQTERASDDGEPSGTAGRPILHVLQGEEIRDAGLRISNFHSAVYTYNADICLNTPKRDDAIKGYIEFIQMLGDLDKIVQGDKFFISVCGETFAYQVDKIEIVEPDQTQGLALVDGKDYVTLVTCTPYGVNTHRILCRGYRVPYVPGDENAVKQRAWLNMNIMFGLVGALLGILISLLVVIRKRKQQEQ